MKDLRDMARIPSFGNPPQYTAPPMPNALERAGTARFKEGDLVQIQDREYGLDPLRIRRISGSVAFLYTEKGEYVDCVPLKSLRLAPSRVTPSSPEGHLVRGESSEDAPSLPPIPPSMRSALPPFQSDDIVIHKGEEVIVSFNQEGLLGIEGEQGAYLVSEDQVQRAPFRNGDWVRVHATGLVGQVTWEDNSYSCAVRISGSKDLYHRSDLVRIVKPSAPSMSPKQPNEEAKKRGIKTGSLIRHASWSLHESPETVVGFDAEGDPECGNGVVYRARECRVVSKPLDQKQLWDNTQVNDILLYASSHGHTQEVRVARIVYDTLMVEGYGGLIYGCTDYRRLQKAPIRVGDWIRTPNGYIVVTPESLREDGIQCSDNFYPMSDVTRIMRPQMKPIPLYTMEVDPGGFLRDLRGFDRKSAPARSAELGRRIHSILEDVVKDKSALVDAHRMIADQIETLRERQSALGYMDGKIKLHLLAHMDSWNLGDDTVYINIKRDIDLNEFTESYSNFLEAASEAFDYVVRFVDAA